MVEIQSWITDLDRLQLSVLIRYVHMIEIDDAYFKRFDGCSVIIRFDELKRNGFTGYCNGFVLSHDIWHG
jgi:hypothetical protein